MKKISSRLLLSLTLMLPSGICVASAPAVESYEALSHRLVAVSEDEIEARAADLIKKSRERLSSPKDQKDAEQFISAAKSTPFWRFYLMNGGLNGPLTEYMTLYHEEYKLRGVDMFGNKIGVLDQGYMEETPHVLAYQQNHRNCRQAINNFLLEQAKAGKTEFKLASIACGTLYEFMKIEFPAGTQGQLYGYDIDPESVRAAEANGRLHKRHVVAKVQDAWKTLADAPFDVITCNGFTFYEKDDERLTALFRNFYESLNKGGKMIARFIQPHDLWDTSGTSDKALHNLKMMMENIPSKWSSAFRDQDRMKIIAMKAGFSEGGVLFVVEGKNIHPSIVATK